MYPFSLGIHPLRSAFELSLFLSCASATIMVKILGANLHLWLFTKSHARFNLPLPHPPTMLKTCNFLTFNIAFGGGRGNNVNNHCNGVLKYSTTFQSNAQIIDS